MIDIIFGWFFILMFLAFTACLFGMAVSIWRDLMKDRS